MSAAESVSTQSIVAKIGECHDAQLEQIKQLTIRCELLDSKVAELSIIVREMSDKVATMTKSVDDFVSLDRSFRDNQGKLPHLDNSANNNGQPKPTSTGKGIKLTVDQIREYIHGIVESSFNETDPKGDRPKNDKFYPVLEDLGIRRDSLLSASASMIGNTPKMKTTNLELSNKEWILKYAKYLWSSFDNTDKANLKTVIAERMTVKS